MSMVNLFIDHPTDTRKSYVAYISDEFAHPMIDFLDKTLPREWGLSMDCWCAAICRRAIPYDDFVTLGSSVSPGLERVWCRTVDNVFGTVSVETQAGERFTVPQSALAPECECGNRFRLCHPDA